MLLLEYFKLSAVDCEHGVTLLDEGLLEELVEERKSIDACNNPACTTAKAGSAKASSSHRIEKYKLKEASSEGLSVGDRFFLFCSGACKERFNKL